MTSRLSLIMALLLAYTGMAFAQDEILTIEYMATHPDLSGNNPHWLLDPQSQCWAFDMYPVPSESVRWSGMCKDGLASGNGTLTWLHDGKPAQSLTGDFSLGSLTGHGNEILSGASVYDGELLYSTRSGHGILNVRGQGVYDGDWPGQGTWTDTSGGKCRATVTRERGSLHVHPRC